eukprot:310893-Hanusia_phi.AAC.1
MSQCFCSPIGPYRQPPPPPPPASRRRRSVVQGSNQGSCTERPIISLKEKIIRGSRVLPPD